MLNAAPGPCSLSQYLQDGQENTLHVIYFLFFKTFLFCIGVCMLLSHFSRVRLFATLWTVALHVLLSLGFFRQEHWSGLPCPPPGDLPNPGIEPASHYVPCIAGGFFTTSATWEAQSHRVPKLKKSAETRKGILGYISRACHLTFSTEKAVFL